VGLAALVVTGAALGWASGQATGAVLGAVFGVLAVALAGVVAGGPASVTFTIVACALLGGWLRWQQQAPPPPGTPSANERGLS
jgi:hypothetical protein